MRISDWSSDVCSSDLRARRRSQATVTARGNGCLQSDSTCSPSGDASRGHSGVGWEAKKEPRTTATERLIFVDTPEANRRVRSGPFAVPWTRVLYTIAEIGRAHV